MSYALVNKMTTKDGKRDEVLDILLKSGSAFDENEHCLMYLVSKDKNAPNVIWVHDIWTDAESHEQSMQDETMQQYIKQAMPLLEGMPQQFEIELVGGKQKFTQ